MWEKASQRTAFAEALVELGKESKDVVVLGADLSCSTKTSEFDKLFPERFYNAGIAEQNMMGMAAGLAMSGKTVIASTFAVFATGRVYDQIRQSIAYPNLNVKIVATHAGITVGGDGASHQITEDIALMRVLPNMTVVVPADGPETYKAVKAAVAFEGPMYIRLGRANMPVITKKDDHFTIGKATVVRKGKDVTLVGTGVMVSKCLEAALELEKEGIHARVINMSTIKKIDKAMIIKAARETGAMVTAEEHNVTMGMGDAVAKVLVENVHIPMKKVGIPDLFGESGNSDELMDRYGLNVKNLVDAAHDVITRRDEATKRRRSFWSRFSSDYFTKAEKAQKKTSKKKKTKK